MAEEEKSVCKILISDAQTKRDYVPAKDGKPEIPAREAKEACYLDIGYVVDYSKQDIDTTIPSYETTAGKIKTLKETNLTDMKKALKEEWEAQRLTGAEYAAAIIQANAAASQGAAQEVAATNDLIFKSKEMLMKEKRERVEIALSLLKLRDAEMRIKESQAKVDLYKEQAKGYRDQTKLNSIKLVFSTWSTMYTQNQLESHPNFITKPNIEQTVKEWFEYLDLGNPNETNS